MNTKKRPTAKQAEVAGYRRFIPRYRLRLPKYVARQPALLAAYRAGYLRAAAEDFDKYAEYYVEQASLDA